MPDSTTHSIPQDKFLTMAANLLYKTFLESSRTKAKNAYKEMLAGKVLPLTTVQMEDKSTVRFGVALDHSEYRGSLSFGAFRSSLGLLLSQLGETLRKKEEVRVFAAQHDANVMIFGVTAVTRETRETTDPNIMVLGANMGGEKPSVLLNLMYLNHQQFAAESKKST